MLHKTIYKLISISLCLVIALSLCSCSCNMNSSEPITKNGFALDTVITITLYGNDDKKYIDDCFNIAKKYDDILSNTKENSDIYKINHANNEFVEVNSDTIELIQQGKYYGDLSNGVFDVSIGKLTGLWDIKNRTVPPTQEEVNNAMGFNYKNIEIDGNKVRLKTDKEQLDLGGIAKGFIADKIKDYLNANGVTKGVINLGGNVLCLDKKDGKTNYNIGIQKPFDESGTPLCALSVSNTSIVTSGDYQRYFEYEGKKYHHIIDVNTGFPVDNELDSVTIISSSSTAGDALSTIAFAYGLEKGMNFIESIPNTDAIFVTKDGNIHKTSGVDNNMLKTN